MGTARRIYKNAMYLGAAEIVSRALQFVVMLYAARLLSKEHFGKFSFALSLSLIAIVLADLGINTLLIREIARNKKLANKYFVNALLTKAALSLITYLVIAAVLNILKYPQDTRQIAYIILAFAILSNFTELAYSVFRAFEKMLYDAFLKIFRMILLAAASLYVLFNNYGIIAFSYTFVFVEIIVVITALSLILKNFIRLKAIIDFSFIKSILKKSVPFGVAFIFGGIYFYIGSVILSKMRGDAEVAVYSVAYNLALAILFIPNVYTNAVYPVMSRYFKKSKDRLMVIYTKSFKYLYLIGLPISAGLFMLANRIIIFFYGEAYRSSIIALQVLAWFLTIKFLNFLNGTTLASINRQGERMASQGMTALLNIVLSLLLIPKFGYIGAAISMIITEIFLFISYYSYVSKYLHAYKFFSILIKPTIAAGIMMGYIAYAKLDLALIVPTAAMVYFVSIFLMRTFENDDYELLKSALKND